MKVGPFVNRLHLWRSFSSSCHTLLGEALAAIVCVIIGLLVLRAILADREFYKKLTGNERLQILVELSKHVPEQRLERVSRIVNRTRRSS